MFAVTLFAVFLTDKAELFSFPDEQSAEIAGNGVVFCPDNTLCHAIGKQFNCMGIREYSKLKFADKAEILAGDDFPIRMIRIVDMMRKGQYPNFRKINKAFEKATYDTSETMILTCTRKTIYQDMKILKEEFNCPWEYDRSRYGFYLSDPHWDFAYPADLSETQMMALLMGRRISENIFPEPLRGEICRAVDYLLNEANPDLAKCSFVSQMKLFSARTGKVDEEIFDCVYRAWRDHVCLKITYRDYQGKVSEREIKPMHSSSGTIIGIYTRAPSRPTARAVS